MSGQGRPNRRSFGWPAIAAGAVLFVAIAAARGQEPSPNDSPNEPLPGSPAIAIQRNDARLNDVAFVDRKNGWAVGEAGVIWHTTDGGVHWEQQSSGVDCPLRSVQFLDANVGWAAGGFTLPYTHLSTGVILHTTDGGQHWGRMEKLLLPALQRIKFFGTSRGWAIGNWSPLYNTSLFFTENGGREWTPIQSANGWSKIAGDFSSASTGIICTDDGITELLTGKTTSVVHGRYFFGWGEPYLRTQRVACSGPEVTWLVGDGGLIETTADGGKTWRTISDELPVGIRDHLSAELKQHYDFTALAVRGPNVWIAASPGTLVLHSADGGKTWDIQATGQLLPIDALTFVDDTRGWAVGALGTILATDDGGQTWHRQRCGGERVALMGIFSEAADVPLELFGRASAADGYLSVVELLNRRDITSRSPADAILAARADEALVALGSQCAESAWQFPLRQRGLDMPLDKTLAIWDRATNGHGLEQLEARLVHKIRVWRPDVIVLSDAADLRDDPVRQLIERTVLQAIDHAADPAYDAASTLPLPLGEGTWVVNRVYAVLPAGRTGEVNLATGQLTPRLGRSLAEITWQPRGLLLDEYAPAPESIGLRLVQSRDGEHATQGDLCAGLNLEPGGEARRALGEPPAEAIDSLRRMAQQRRNVQALLKHTPEASDRWLAQVGQLIAGLGESSAGEILFQLGWQAYRAGNWDAAAQAFELLTTQYASHPLAPPARVWLLQSYASGAVAQRIRSTQNRTADGVVQAAAQLPIDATSGNAVTAPPTDSSAADPRATRAVQLAQQIERTDPALFAEPDVRLPLAAAYRRLGMLKDADHCLSSIRNGPHDAWWACAAGEDWLDQNRGESPKSIWHCALATKRPRLDGQLDDDVWQHAESVELHSAANDDADWPAAAMLAYDQQFLYLAVRCHQASEADYSPADGPRPRSADLRRRDRIDLLLSPDRDYSTWYRVSIDDRGWVNTGCRGDTSWRPALFIAAATADKTWTIEAAIPWTELTDSPPTSHSRQPWAANIQRIIPGVGFQSWSTPATIEIQPAGFGFLMFK